MTMHSVMMFMCGTNATIAAQAIVAGWWGVAALNLAAVAVTVCTALKLHGLTQEVLP